MKDRYEALGGIIQLAMIINHDMTKSLARDGLTPARVQLLWTLHERGPVTQRTLADALGVSARNITGLVDGLASGEFVTREPHPTDRRATLVSLTAKGRSAMAQMDRDREEFAQILFAGMPQPQFDGFAAGLTEVLTRLGKAGLELPKGEQ